MKLYRDTDNILLTLKISDEVNDLFPTAKVYGNDNILISTYSLVSNGTIGYYTLLLAPLTLPIGSYNVVYEVFRDSGHTSKEKKYLDAEEFLRIENIQTTSTANVAEIIDNVDDHDAQVAY